MNWNLEGQRIDAVYMGVPVSGLVTGSRVKYGGTCQHSLELDQPIQLPWRGEPIYRVLVDDEDIVCENPREYAEKSADIDAQYYGA